MDKAKIWVVEKRDYESGEWDAYYHYTTKEAAEKCIQDWINDPDEFNEVDETDLRIDWHWLDKEYEG